MRQVPATQPGLGRGLGSPGRSSLGTVSYQDALGAPKAITATAHKLARIIYNLMRYGVAYMKREEAAYAEQVRARVERSFHRQAKELGYEVKKVEPPAPVEPVEVPTG